MNGLHSYKNMQRRMFSPKIVDSDAFLDMPQTSQLLYFHLAMRADDDGFVGNPKKILRMIGGNDDDMKVLIGKRFILTFESGIIVIKHWKIHNLIRSDRYKETQYLEEKSSLIEKENGSYTELNKGLLNGTQNVIPNVNHRVSQVRLGKVRLGKVSESTPAEISKSFFEGGKHYDDIREEMEIKVPQPLLDVELKKFNLYWTEPNKSGTRVRWEQQNTFDVRRRLITWFARMKEQHKPKQQLFV